MNVLVVGIFLDNDIITFREVILALEVVEEVESFIKVSNTKDINSAKNDRKQEEWSLDGRIDFVVHHDDAEADGDDGKDGERGDEVDAGQEVDNDNHGTEHGTADE